MHGVAIVENHNAQTTRTESHRHSRMGEPKCSRIGKPKPNFDVLNFPNPPAVTRINHLIQSRISIIKPTESFPMDVVVGQTKFLNRWNNKCSQTGKRKQAEQAIRSITTRGKKIDSQCGLPCFGPSSLIPAKCFSRFLLLCLHRVQHGSPVRLEVSLKGSIFAQKEWCWAGG